MLAPIFTRTLAALPVSSRVWLFFFFVFKMPESIKFFRAFWPFFSACVCATRAKHTQFTWHSNHSVPAHFTNFDRIHSQERRTHKSQQTRLKERAKRMMAYHAQYTRAVCVYFKCMSYVCLEYAINASGSNRETMAIRLLRTHTHTWLNSHKAAKIYDLIDQTKKLPSNIPATLKTPRNTKTPEICNQKFGVLCAVCARICAHSHKYHAFVTIEWNQALEKCQQFCFLCAAAVAASTC